MRKDRNWDLEIIEILEIQDVSLGQPQAKRKRMRSQALKIEYDSVLSLKETDNHPKDENPPQSSHAPTGPKNVEKVSPIDKKFPKPFGNRG